MSIEHNSKFANLSVSDQVEALLHAWDDYFCPPHRIEVWPGVIAVDKIANLMIDSSKIILLSALTAAIPLQIFVYYGVMDWRLLAPVALLVLEVGPCRPLTRLSDRIPPYPDNYSTDVSAEFAE